MKLRKILLEILNDYLNEDSDLLRDTDLYNIAKWGLEGEYSLSGCWDDNDNIEDAIYCAIEDFKSVLSEPYPSGLKNIPSHPVIYRLVRLKNVSDLRKDKLGHSWFATPNQFETQGFFDMLDHLTPFKNEEGAVYIIKGKTSVDNIDMKNTLWHRSTQWIENEIVILDDSKVKILSVDMID